MGEEDMGEGFLTEGDPAGKQPGECHACPGGPPAGGREQLQRRAWDGPGT